MRNQALRSIHFKLLSRRSYIKITNMLESKPETLNVPGGLFFILLVQQYVEVRIGTSYLLVEDIALTRSRWLVISF